MNCQETGILLHALIDDELDAFHAREVESHLVGCPHCTAKLRRLREMRQALSSPGLRFEAPSALRLRIENSLQLSRPRAPAVPSRRSLLKGFAMGSLISAAAAASLMVVVVGDAQDQRILGDVVSAHLRSLQADHLTDVATSDQHTVKPWFNGRLDVSPPVADLTAQGFTLIGGRLDYIDGRPVAAIVYKRRAHVINLFVSQSLRAGSFTPRLTSVQGFNIRRWSDQGLDLLAVSDINADELQEFGEKFAAALHSGNTL